MLLKYSRNQNNCHIEKNTIDNPSELPGSRVTQRQFWMHNRFKILSF